MTQGLTLLLIVVAAIVIGPLLTIWSLNTLFPVLNIPYALDTWIAIIFLGVFIRAKVQK